METREKIREANKTGATSKDLWNLYRLLPENSCVTYKFYYDGEDELYDEVSIWKNNNTTSNAVPEYISAKEGKNRLYNLIRKYGFDSYRLKMEWNYGFGGNSVLISVYSPKSKEVNQ